MKKLVLFLLFSTFTLFSQAQDAWKTITMNFEDGDQYVLFVSTDSMQIQNISVANQGKIIYRVSDYVGNYPICKAVSRVYQTRNISLTDDTRNTCAGQPKFQMYYKMVAEVTDTPGGPRKGYGVKNIPKPMPVTENTESAPYYIGYLHEINSWGPNTYAVEVYVHSDGNPDMSYMQKN